MTLARQDVVTELLSLNDQPDLDIEGPRHYVAQVVEVGSFCRIAGSDVHQIVAVRKDGVHDGRDTSRDDVVRGGRFRHCWAALRSAAIRSPKFEQAWCANVRCGS